MSHIYKYTLAPISHQVMVCGEGVPLCAKEQNGNLCVWVKHDKDIVYPTEGIEILIVCTGEEFDQSTYTYLDTVQIGTIVVHVLYR